MGVANDAHHILRRSPLSELKLESIPEPLDRSFALERGELGAEHKVARIAKLISVRPDRQESLDCELGEHPVSLRSPSAHQADHLMVELERAWLELDSTWANVEEEAEINMDDVAFPVNHDVSIVTVLDLKDIACDGICRHRLDEVQSSFLERDGIDAAVLVDEVSKEIVDLRSAHFVARRGVGHDVNDTALKSALFHSPLKY